MTPMQAAKKIKEYLVKAYGEDNTTELVIWDKAKGAQMGYGEGVAAVVWEGGPYEWAIETSMNPTVLAMSGVFAEPYNGFILNLYND